MENKGVEAPSARLALESAREVAAGAGAARTPRRRPVLLLAGSVLVAVPLGMAFAPASKALFLGIGVPLWALGLVLYLGAANPALLALRADRRLDPRESSDQSRRAEQWDFFLGYLVTYLPLGSSNLVRTSVESKSWISGAVTVAVVALLLVLVGRWSSARRQRRIDQAVRDAVGE